MRFLQFTRRITIGSSLMLVMLLLAMVGAPFVDAHVATTSFLTSGHTANHVPYNPEVQRLRQLVREGRLAPTLHVLDSLPPTLIVQFSLVPSGIKSAFPQATALVTIVRGSRENSLFDTVTLDVTNMPPNITFTIFFIELANKPFGNVEWRRKLSDDTTAAAHADLWQFRAGSTDGQGARVSRSYLDCAVPTVPGKYQDALSESHGV